MLDFTRAVSNLLWRHDGAAAIKLNATGRAPIRVATMLVVAGLFSTSSVVAADTAATMQAEYQIHVMNLADALTRFGTQSGLQVVYPPELARGLKASEVSGRLTADAALKQLLTGTGLTWSYVNGNIVVLKADKAEASTAKKNSSPNQSAPAILEEIVVKGIPEILVRGSRSANTDIERTEDDPQPYVVFDKEEIRRSQSENLGEFLRTRLPMNTAGGGSEVLGPGTPFTVSTVNLRGLGTNQTLILVDGRRMPSVSSRGSPGQPDINGIPLAAVERIEVLPSTAGGIYGGSATGGVVNIILRRDYSGIEVEANYGNTFRTDAANIRFDATAGFALEGGRTQVMLTAAHAEADRLKVGDRDFAARSRALQLANNPNVAAFTTASSPPLGSTANIRSANGTPLVLDAQFGSVPLNSAITHIPFGYTGPASDNGAALVANAGRYNLDISNDINGLQQTLRATPTTDSVSMSIRREFGSRLQAFMDVSHLSNKGSSYGTSSTSPPNTASNLPANAPNNPFQQAINVRFPTPNLLFKWNTESTAIRATGGLILRLPYEWTGGVEYAWSRSRYENVFAQSIVDSATQATLNTGLPAADGRPALNALQEGNTFPMDFSPYLLPLPNAFDGPSDTILRDAMLRLSGPTFRMPGGPLVLSALFEYRKEVVEDSFLQGINSTTRAPLIDFYPERSQEVRSYYLESRAPLISQSNALPGVRELELQVSLRRDEYETRSVPSGSIRIPSREGPFPSLDNATGEFDADKYTLGLRYMPIQDVVLRASFGMGFLPPSVTQIAPTENPSATSDGFADPKRGDTPIYVGVPYTAISGGNPNLKPEESESWSAGVIFTPRNVPGFRLSIDYTKIEKSDEIRAPGTQFVLDNEDVLPGRVQRGPRRPGDPADWAGPVTLIDSTFINIAQTKVEAYDFQIDYSLATKGHGEFRWNAVATYQSHYRNQTLPTEPIVEYAGFNNGPLRWRGSTGLMWDKGPLTVGWNTQFYDSYYVYPAQPLPLSPALQTSRENQILNNGTERFPTQTYHDLIAVYRFNEGPFASGLFANTEVSFGIQNVLDKSPPIIARTSAFSIGGASFSSYGDPRLRRYSLTLRKSF